MNLRADVALTLCTTGHLVHNRDTAQPVVVARDEHVPIQQADVIRFVDLRPVSGSMANQYMVELRDFKSHDNGVGWVLCTVGLSINGTPLGFKPLTFYAGEASDWSTGLVAWSEPGQANPGRLNSWWTPGPVWQLGVRTRWVSTDGR